MKQKILRTDQMLCHTWHDEAAGKPIHVPANYYPDNRPDEVPLQSWRSHAHLLFSNWLNQIYQDTPYDREDIGKPSA